MYEPDTQSLIEAFCDQETIFLDIGAAYGCMSLLAAASRARVYSYEPNPQVFRGLISNALLNQTLGHPIRVFNKAVSTKSRSLDLTTSNTNQILSPIVFTNWNNKSVVEVVGLTEVINAVQSRHSSNHKLVIKMDIEGAEWVILQDSETLKCLKLNRCLMILALHPGLHRPPKYSKGILGKLKFYSWNFRNILEVWSLFVNISPYCSIYRTNLSQVKRPIKFSLLVLAGNHEFVLSFGRNFDY
jgi:FkbM family methyltransferase